MAIQSVKKHKAVLFDLDGTLTESAPGIINSLIYALEKFDIEIPADRKQLECFIGPPLTESFAEYCGFSEEEIERGMEYYREYYAEKGIFDNALYPGIREMLDRMKAENIEMMVATSKPEPFARKILSHFKIDTYFSCISGSTFEEKKDNKPLVIAHALEQCKKEKSEILMVGDRHFDVDGAHKNGIDCAGVLYGYGSKEELQKAGAEYLLETPEEIFTLF